jgi:putative transposase
MINRCHELAISHQAKLLGISRGSVYYQRRSMNEEDIQLMHRLDQLHLEYPFMGARMLRDQLFREGKTVGRTHIGTLMKRMGIEAVYQKPKTSKKHPGHTVYRERRPVHHPQYLLAGQAELYRKDRYGYLPIEDEPWRHQMEF